MAQIHESAPRLIEGIVPAVGILVSPGALDPLKDGEERVEFDLPIHQALVIPKPPLQTLLPTPLVPHSLLLTHRQLVKENRTGSYLSHTHLADILSYELPSVQNNLCIPQLQSFVFNVEIGRILLSFLFLLLFKHASHKEHCHLR